MTVPFAYSGSSETASRSEPLPAALAAALERLQTEDFAHRWDAAKVIQRYGEIAIAPLLNLLQENDDDELCWFIIRALGDSAHPQAIQALMQLLQSTDAEDVRQAAAVALAQHPDEVLPLLESLLTDEQGRSHAILVLAQLHHPQAISLLLPLATDPDPKIRTLAIEALSYSHNPSVLPILKQGLTDPIAAIRRATVVGLGAWSEERYPWELVALITPLLHDLNLDVRRQAILTVGRLGHEAAIAPLNDALRSPHTPDSLRPDLVRSLSWISHPQALACLQRELQTTPDAALAQEIVALLGRLTDETLLPLANQIVLDALQLENAVLKRPEVRRAIAHSLGQLRQPDALSRLTLLLLDGDRSVQLHALAALKTWDPAPLAEALQRLQNQVQLSADLQADLSQLLAELALMSQTSISLKGRQGV